MTKNQLGLTAIELVIVIGIFTLSALLILTPQLEIQKLLIDSQKKMERTAHLDTFRQGFLSSHTSLRKSALLSPDNDPLCPCLLGTAFSKDAATTCKLTTCTANTTIDFTYINPQGTSAEKIAGTTSQPVYYHSNGSFCSGDAAQQNPETVCSYKIVSRFRAHCAGDLPSCEHADYLAIYIDVAPTLKKTKLQQETFQILYPVSLNYSPTIAPITPQNLNLHEEKTVAVIANPGHASESTNFTFEKCLGSNADVFDVKCYGFINGIGQVILIPKKEGSGRVTIQINDGGNENNLSEPMEIAVSVLSE